MFRFKDTLTTGMFSEDPQRSSSYTISCLSFNCDERGRFRRALVVLDPSDSLMGLIVLVDRDGSLRNKIAAVALFPLEDNDNYTWFFGHIMRNGFSLESSLVFSDRNVGLVSAADNLKIFIMFCIRHIVGNMRSDKSVRITVAQERFVCEANTATSRSDFDSAMSGLMSANSAADAYLNAIPHHKWALYADYATTPLYGWRTANFGESEQAKNASVRVFQVLHCDTDG
uniref:AlNc14C14G1653 protein n=1 Tax=Albugo laibachii Nc14 TaxID=890382 RepID=F0W3S7_9STRA|nr:AlNc14C14G1653 [Albugo laibachii Nc14]|eukprot:CCA15747.1 AlNc14C14G1653 [Albugo laibachii Nc14]